MKLFISYAHVDRYRVEELVNILRNAGHDPWFDHKLLPGQDWQDELLNAVLACDVFVYAMTQHSIDSEWCQWEFQQAVKNSKSIMPVLLHKSTTIPQSLSQYQYADFSMGPTPTSVAQLIGGIHSLSVQVPLSDLGKPIEKPTGIPPQAVQGKSSSTRLWIALFVVLGLAGGGLLLSGVLASDENPDALADSITASHILDTQIPTTISTFASNTVDNLTTSPVPTTQHSTSLSAQQLANQALELHYDGDYDFAIEVFTEAIELDPDFAYAYNYRGWTYFNLGDHESAIADLDKAIDLDARYALAYNYRGLISHRLGDYGQAIDDFDQSIDLVPNYAYAYNNRGISYYELGEYQTAIVDYDRAIKLDPIYATAFSNRGLANLRLEDYPTAIEDYTVALELNPNLAEAYWGLGKIYDLQQEFDLALENYQTYLDLAGGSASPSVIERVQELRGE